VTPFIVFAAVQPWEDPDRKTHSGTIADLQRYVKKLTIPLVNVFCHRNQKKARKSQKIDMNLTKYSGQRDPPGARD
jgi:hypothetical protein